MKRLFMFLAAIPLFILFFVSCYYDNEEALYPIINTACDTTNVTFSRTIVPILSNNCYSCHSSNTSTFGGNIRLETFADVQLISSKLIPAVKRTGAKPMPPGGMLKACSISQFDIWIRNGMVNN